MLVAIEGKYDKVFEGGFDDIFAPPPVTNIPVAGTV
jgi:hypothetical protein